MIKTAAQSLFWLILLVFLLVPFLIYGLLGTKTGTRWLLQEQILSERLDASVAKVEGTLLSDLYLKNVSYQSDTETVTLEAFTFSWNPLELLKGKLHIKQISANSLTLNTLKESDEPKDDSPFSIPNIPIDIYLDAFSITDIRVKNKESESIVEKVAFSALYENNSLQLKELALEMPELSAEGHGKIKISDQWPLSAALKWRLHGPDIDQISGETSVGGDINQLQLTGLISGAGVVKYNAQVILSGEEPVFNINGEWNQIQWPLAGAPQISSKQGQFKVSGSLEQYALQLNSSIATDQLPPFTLTLTGQGNAESLTDTLLTLKPKNGQLKIKGDVNWAETIQFAVNVAAENINPGDFISDFPGSLNLKASSSGSIDSEHIKARLDIAEAKGKFKGRPVSAGGQLQIEDQTYRFNNLKIRSAENSVAVNGSLTDQQADLKFIIKAPNLSTAWPGLSGSITGLGNVHGPFKNPIIFSKLEVLNLTYQDIAIQQANLSIDYAEALGEQSRIDTQIQGFNFSGQKIETIELTGAGSLAKHKLEAHLHSAEIKLDMSINGYLNKQTWTAVIPALSLYQRQLATWALSEPAQLRLKPHADDFELSLTSACLYQDISAICIAAEGLLNTDLQAQLDAKSINLAVLKPWLPEQLNLDGKLTAKADVAKTESDFNAQISASIPKTIVHISQTENQPVEFPLSATEITANYQNQQLNTDIQIGLGGHDFIKAHVDTHPLSENNQRLSGTIAAKVTDMAFFDALIPEIDQLKGQLDASLVLSGTTEQPLINGQCRFFDGSMKIPLAGITLSEFGINLTSHAHTPEQLLLDGKVKSGQGNLQLTGHIDLNQERGFPVTLNITGTDFQVARLPEAEVYVSPQLKVEQNQNRTKVTGSVTIPKAKLKLTEIPENAVAASEDEIIIGAPEKTEPAAAKMLVETDIDIILGEKVHFSGYGLETALTGKLKYVSTSKRQSMQGRVGMQKAKYKAYGQDLSLKHGEFLFNGPADNPWLNIEANRKATGEDITAILRVTGPLKAPVTKVSTEPPLPESDALAYLLTGRSLQRVGESQSNALAKAAFSYGAGQLSWLSDQMGIDEFEVEDAEKLEQSAVRLGKYITPDFYIGLSLGFFSNNYAVLFKQQLTKHFSLQTRAGETQRLDLKYQIETD